MLISTNKNGRFRLLVNLMTAKVIFQYLIKSLNVVANFHELTCADFTNQSREYIVIIVYVCPGNYEKNRYLFDRKGKNWNALKPLFSKDSKLSSVNIQHPGKVR